MEIDEAIAQLGEKLDVWCDNNLATFGSKGGMAQVKALLAGSDIAKELDALKAKGLVAISALLDRPRGETDDERVASLVHGFAFGAKLACTLHDELLDVDGETKILQLMSRIVKKLEAIGSGRLALSVLLDHPDARVRALAGNCLLSSMPDRVLPILRDIEEHENGNSAFFTASNTITHWKRKKQQA